MAEEYKLREYDKSFAGSGAGTPEDPVKPIILVEGVVDGDIVVDFTDLLTAVAATNTKLDQLKALVGTAGDDENDVTVIGLLTRIALGVEALA